MAEETDIFLSHNWGTDSIGRNNHERVSKINEQLKSMGYSTWFDEEQMSGDIVEQMAEGIENSKVALLFITNKYCEKVNGGKAGDNCELEFDHAIRVKSTDNVLAVVLESDMTNTAQWRGKVGIQLGNKLYVNISGNVNDPVYLKAQCQNIHDVIRNFPNLRDNCDVETQANEQSKHALSKAEAANEAKARRAKSSRGQIKFVAEFTNNHTEDIDLVWKNYEGGEVIVRQGVTVGSTHGEGSYFTHPFIARDVVTEQVVPFTANGVTSVVFEGLNFHAPHNGRVAVSIGVKK